MEVIKTGEVREFKQGGTVKKTVSAGGQLAVNLFFIDSGGSVPLHRHADTEEVFYIIDGGATFTLGEEARTVTAGDIIHVPQEQWHGVRNDSGNPLTFLTTLKAGAHYEAKT